jgi:gamma-glutamyltranspeptidase/glutathione hydrolase
VTIAVQSLESARPIVWGQRGAAGTAHPLATAAAQEILASGGVDAAVAAQAALAVVLPQSCGVGGDSVGLVHRPSGEPAAFIGSGVVPRASSGHVGDDGSAVTVPGAVDAWSSLVEAFGRRSLGEVLRPAIRLARDGIRVDEHLVRAVAAQRSRLERGGARHWSLLRARVGESLRQPELAALLESLAELGADTFYGGAIAAAIVDAVRGDGGSLAVEDLAHHATVLAAPIEASWRGQVVLMPPPPSQAVLLGMVLRSWDRGVPTDESLDDHAQIELVKAAFEFRDQIWDRPDLLEVQLDVDARGIAPNAETRPYLHTAAVATADADGNVVSSLVSLFDDFGSGTFVPQGGFVLNNRAAGFTRPPNHARPGVRPVHTLAPVMLRNRDEVTAVATPGADGQVQTLLQVLARGSMGWSGAISAPRWRSEGSRLLVARDHPNADALKGQGYDVELLDGGDVRFGSVVVAGVDGSHPLAVTDWRRQSWAGAA